ncbi:Na+/H+ antiporter subunit E [Microbacterium sp. APC 3898]|uniref:Na+/H+ antiporter subunit E n=2 Tax=Planococcus TaxID=1372 RepID=A0ABT7ZNX9_9BACL|nr:MULTISPECIES: Na+/H+ antiporter subunit E [Terrabacteria group]MBF6632529.1 Na+/H+ antiporter subunit E [Planococcus sp. (in: firmicutes)]MBD8016305.1 Na+/H+ antiporter subunit E [Planococcus wigleyi]MDN3428845.1 Na+/H+ antiporter subunit E [Planococcus sp. APC 4016]MDN3439361.1 Na+/H+ antiporter subunit E [Planococcus sp. APC 3900]MDN3500034.1 Na+/H+ antiporter subunit E [Microbacterium sp. APC 3898]
MALQILLNFFLAFVWMFMTVSFSPAGFAIGFLVGLGIIILMRRFFSYRLYTSRVWAVIFLILLFLKELLMSSIQVLRIVLKPNMNLKPAIFELETELKEDWEITLLSALITLTPGTLVVGISNDQKRLFIHALDFEDIDDAVNSIKDTFERAILEVSRP